IDDILYCFIRTSGRLDYKIAKYDLISGIWSDYHQIGNQDYTNPSRTLFFEKQGKLYAMYNTVENPVTGWNRGVVLISEIDLETLEIKATQTIYAPHSCQYFDV